MVARRIRSRRSSGAFAAKAAFAIELLTNMSLPAKNLDVGGS